MRNPGLPDALWAKLDGRLWHATTRDAIARIVADREIKPVVGNRYRNSFCTSLGCVCLFDFGPAAENLDGQFNNWASWFGHQQESGMAVWLEIDRVGAGDALTDAGKTRALWREHMSKRIIPGVEACHKGSIPIERVSSILLVARDDLTIFDHRRTVDPAILGIILEFEGRLPPAPRNEIVEALLAARRKS